MPKVCVVSFPWASRAPYKFLSNLLKILEPLSDSIVLINGNTDRIEANSEKVKVVDIGISMHYAKDTKPQFFWIMLWVAKCILVQVKTSLELIKVRKEVDIVIFYVAYPYYLLPLITSKILRKKAIAVVTRSKPSSTLAKIISLQDPILFGLLDGISPESKAVIKEVGLEKYNYKLLPEGARFIDISCYTIKKKLNERKNMVGFIGRIRKEKGIIEFINAIPLVAKKNKNVEFLIGGSGDLLDRVNAECNKIKDKSGVNIITAGWIGQELPDYLNELQLLVLPTYTDAFPTIILEAMACGTPVLATPVGAIPDVIKDEETGFILESNSPECIAENIIKALNYSNLEEIVKNARELIDEKYTYESAVKRYREMLTKL